MNEKKWLPKYAHRAMMLSSAPTAFLIGGGIPSQVLFWYFALGVLVIYCVVDSNSARDSKGKILPLSEQMKISRPIKNKWHERLNLIWIRSVCAAALLGLIMKLVGH